MGICDPSHQKHRKFRELLKNCLGRGMGHLSKIKDYLEGGGVLATDSLAAPAHSSLKILSWASLHLLPSGTLAQVFKLEHYLCPPFSVPPSPNLLFILTHFVALDCTGQAECLDQPATILNQFFNIATCSYLKNKWEMNVLKLCTQKTRLMSCNPNMCRNSLWLSALVAPNIQSHPVKWLMLHFWELNPRSKEEKPQHGALCTGKCLSFQRGYLESHRNKPDSAIANG